MNFNGDIWIRIDESRIVPFGWIAQQNGIYILAAATYSPSGAVLWHQQTKFKLIAFIRKVFILRFRERKNSISVLDPLFDRNSLAQFNITSSFQSGHSGITHQSQTTQAQVQ